MFRALGRFSLGRLSLSQSTLRYLVALKHMAVVNNCRLFDYQDGVKRFPVPEGQVSWSVDWPEYEPVDHTHPAVLKGPVWADLDFRCCHITLKNTSRPELSATLHIWNDPTWVCRHICNVRLILRGVYAKFYWTLSPWLLELALRLIWWEPLWPTCDRRLSLVREYRIAGILFRGYKCSRFSRIKPVPHKFIPTNLISHACMQAV